MVPERRPSLLALRAGVPASALDLLSDDAPLVAGAIERADALELAAAITVTDPPQLMVRMAQGGSARFRSDRDPSTGGEILTANDGPSAGMALGLFGDHLTVATSKEALLALGPWLDRTLGPRAKASSARNGVDADLEIDASGRFLSAELTSAVRRVWPAPAPAVDSAIGTFASAKDVRVTASFGASDAHCAFSFEDPGDGPWISLEHGSTGELLDAPAGVHGALGWFDGDAERERSAVAASSVLEVALGDAAPRARNDLVALARARKPRSVLALERGARGPTLFGLLDLGDPTRAEAALFDLVEALDQKAPRAALAAMGYSVGAKKTVLERIGDVARFRLGPATSKAHEESKPGLPSSPADGGATLDLVSRVEGDHLYLGGGRDVGDAISRAKGDSRLSAEPPLKTFIDRAPPTSSVVLFVDPAGLVRLQSPRSIFLLTASIDVDGRSATGTLDVDEKAVRALVEAAMAR